VAAFRFIQPCSPIRAKKVPPATAGCMRSSSTATACRSKKLGSRVIIYSRNGHDFTERFPSLAQLLQDLPAKSAVLDGEVVAPTSHT